MVSVRIRTATARSLAPLRAFGVPWKRKVLIYIFAVYAAVVLFFAVMQTRLIFPGHATQGRPEAVVEPPPGTELVRLKTKRGDAIFGLFGPALTPSGGPHPDPASRPTILDFYGNGMCLKAAAEGFDDFRRLGVNLMIVEYPGFGMSEGSPSEANCYAAADAAYDYLLTRADVNSKKIVAMGWSLGGAVAIDLAARRPVMGLVAYSTFTSLTDAAIHHYPILPSPLLLIHRFESKRKIARVLCPILLGHGTADRVVPFSMRDRLARVAGGPVTKFTVEGGDHEDFFAANEGEILNKLADFLAILHETASSQT
jgi:pimeloyl-ACP methyl ester carboxylesterase